MFTFFSSDNDQKIMNEIAINIIPKPRQIKNLKSSFDLLLIDGIRIENNTKYEIFCWQTFQKLFETFKRSGNRAR